MGDTADSVEDYRNRLEGRFRALARTQALLTRTANAGVDLATLVREEIRGQAEHDDQYRLSGPELLLAPKAAEVLTLAVHELATNALKYGALAGAAWPGHNRLDGIIVRHSLVSSPSETSASGDHWELRLRLGWVGTRPSAPRPGWVDFATVSFHEAEVT